jgi:4-hydroxy-tetrahydrodipicolinate synthase
MVGTEALLLPAMAAGASGCITATGNVAAQPIAALFEQRNEVHAAALDRAVNEMRSAFETLPVIPALKAYLAQTTGVDSWRNVRPPLRSLTAGETTQLLLKLDKARQL